MPGQQLINDFTPRAQLRPLSHAVESAMYVPRPTAGHSRKLFQDVSQVPGFQFPAALNAPTQLPAPGAMPNNLVEAHTQMPGNPGPAPADLQKPEPSEVSMRQPVTVQTTRPESEIAWSDVPVPERVEIHRTFAPPAKPPRPGVRLFKLKPRAFTRRVLRAVKAMPLQQQLLTGMAAVVLVIGLGITCKGFQSNGLAQAQAARASIAQAAPATTTDSVEGAVVDNAPSTAPVTAETLRSYQVAPDAARYIRISKLGVLARVLQVGITKDGALATPTNVFDTARYSSSAKPGEPGATLIDGHVSSWTTNGVFYGIKNLVAGDSIEIERGDGKKLEYTVVKSVTYPVDAVDMNALSRPIDATKSGLNLITCGGKYDSKKGEFSQRIGVFAKLEEQSI
ncbi:sortase [Aeromicrobium sp.]|nr:sortase [Candidatus Saccharibacteria bacterium]